MTSEKAMAWQMYMPQMEKLMLAIAKYMSDDPKEWIRNVYISQWSSLYDFGLVDEDVAQLAVDLNVTIPKDGNLGKIADQIIV